MKDPGDSAYFVGFSMSYFSRVDFHAVIRPYNIAVSG